MNIRHPSVRTTFLLLTLLTLLILPALAPAKLRAANFSDLLLLSLSPPGESGPQKFESEHAPLPERRYWLNRPLSSRARGFILHPDGSSRELPLSKEKGNSPVSFSSPWKSKSMHGPNSVYVYDQKREGDALVTRTAKWIVIHHNCSWGHPFRFDENRLTPKAAREIPLEIVPEPLWDGNFHVNTETGMTLSLRVLSYGRPVPDATVTVITEQDWRKEIRTDAEGRARFQLIRDYYPDVWENFQRTRQGALLFVARVEKEKSGVFEGEAYGREILTTSLPWRYRAAKADYTSLASGLAVGFTTILLSLGAVLLYRERRKKPARRQVVRE